MLEREDGLFIEEARQRLEACLQTKLCKPLVPDLISWICFFAALIVAAIFPDTKQSTLGGIALTLMGFFLWDTHLVSRKCQIRQWGEARKNFLHRCKTPWLLPIAFPFILWGFFPREGRITGLGIYFLTLYAFQELRLFPLDNPDLIRGFQASRLRSQPEVLRCAKQIVTDYSPEARKGLAAQIEIQLSALEGLTWPWTIGIGIAADRFIDLLSRTTFFSSLSPESAFIFIFALVLAILLQLTNRVYNYTALVQAIAQLEYEEQSFPELKEDPNV